MIWLLLFATLGTARAGPSLWPFLFIFWGLCAGVLWMKGWL
jgi:hypothetical protein